MSAVLCWTLLGILRRLCFLQVFFCSRSQQDVDAALASFEQQGFAVAGMAADVANKEQREQLVQQVRWSGLRRADVHVCLAPGAATTSALRLQECTDDNMPPAVVFPASCLSCTT
jgi:hypothetical protein